MKVCTVVVTLCLGLVTLSKGQELPLAEPCDQETCQLPECRCSSTDIPGGLAPRHVPQFVTVTFDDGVNVINIETYRRLFANRTNQNGCSSEATFYVSHEYTNYQLVNELYNQGHEIALHSISHRTPQSYWQEATYEIMMEEFGDQKLQMAHFANIPFQDIKGCRMPYLQMIGNASFQMMANPTVNLLYDSSWPTFTFVDPGLWPYTLHYASTQECPVPPCPNASIPGPWVKPMISWIDDADFPCAMVDACLNVPDFGDEEAWFQFIVRNFERHYLGNRAPFGFFTHEWFLAINPAVERALVRFLNMINTLEDVYMVQANKVIEWTRNPVPLSEYNTSEIGRCTSPTPRPCNANSCPLFSEDNQLEYWMGVCTACPRTYPWLGNPLGL